MAGVAQGLGWEGARHRRPGTRGWREHLAGRAPAALSRQLLALALSLSLLVLVARAAAQSDNTPVDSSQLSSMAVVNASFPVNGNTWKAALPCSRWQGVACDGDGMIISLSLALDTLASPGSMPSALGTLTSLTSLQITGGLTGSVPSFLSSLSQLQFLDLTGNDLTGTLSAPTISSLSALTALSLNYNSLSGTIPRAFSALTDLAHLLLGCNSLSGTIPDIFRSLWSLRALDLSTNALSGTPPASLSALPMLVFLDLSSNQLSGRAPTRFLSPYIGTPAGTYRVNGNYFSGSPVPYYNQGSQWFCPSLLMGIYSLFFLPQFGCSILSSQANNCFNASVDPWTPLLASGGGGGGGGGGFSIGADEAAAIQYMLMQQQQQQAQSPGWSGGRGRSGGDRGPYGVSPEQLAKWQDLYESGALGTLLQGPWGQGRWSGFDGSYGSIPSTAGLCFLESQKTPQMCAAFCNALDSRGPCAGLGTCALNATTGAPTCSCSGSARLTFANSSAVAGLDAVTKQAVPCFPSCTTASSVYFPPTAISRPSGQFSGGLTVVPLTNSSLPRKFNRFFRHLSMGFSGSYASPAWTFPNATDWRRRQAVSPVKNQGPCGSCWVFSAVGAVESALAIQGASLPPDISEQQVLDCSPLGSCASGTPSDALNFLAYASPGVANETSYPYLAFQGTCPAAPSPLALTGRKLLQDSGSGSSSSHRRSLLGAVPAPPYSAVMHEQATSSGWFSILLAVQGQPAIADLEADQLSFLTYPGGFVYNDPSCFANQALTHSVLVVGYDLTAPVPYWILKNSWGTNWGEAGYMRLAIQGGYGICGINYTPVRYPVVQGPTPCGPINPCGGGTCAVSSATNVCSRCPVNFKAVTNIDGSRSCAPLLVCNLFASNPCGVGTCVDDGNTGYSCLCPPPSYVPGTTTTGTPTCVPGNTTTKLVTRTGTTCDMVRVTYSLSRAAFSALNPNLTTLCPGRLPLNTVVNVTNPSYAGCRLYYAISVNDTCASIGVLFNVTLSVLNRDLNCSALSLGQQVCVQPGTPLLYACTQYYDVAPGDTCSSIALTVANPPLPPALFYAYNPGIICSNLQPSAAGASLSQYVPSFGSQVCIAAVASNVTSGPVGVANCKYGRYFTLLADTCVKLYHKLYCSKARLFIKYNGFSCLDRGLWQGRPLCRPYKNAAGVCS